MRPLFFLCLTLLAVLAGCSPGPCAKATFDVGSFVLRCELAGDLPEDGGSIEVAHADTADQVLWASIDGSHFLEAAIGQETVEYGRGSFLFSDTESLRCTGQEVQRVESDGSSVIARGSFSDCELDWEMHFEAESATRLGVRATLSDESYNRISWLGASQPDEGFYGFGAQFNHLNHKGLKLPIWAQEQGHGRGSEPLTSLLELTEGNSAGDWFTTYTAVPFGLSDAGRGVYLDNQEYLEFDLVEPTKLQVDLWSNELRAGLVQGPEPRDLVRGFTEYTGRMAPLPDWSQGGPIVRLHGGSKAVRRDVAEMRAAGVPLAGVWLEDWCGLRNTLFGTRIWWNWDIDRGLYPDWEELVAELEEDGVKVLAYMNPFLTDPADKEFLDRNLYEEAIEGGYLVGSPDSDVFLVDQGGFDAGIVDLTNPDVREWLKAVMIDLIGTGVRGWMADFGEALPYDAVLHSGEDARSYHNQFPYEWARLVREASQDAGVEDDFLFFSRSGNAWSPGETRLFWLGDQTVTWDEYDGFRTVIPGLLNAGLSGYSLEHTDTGGWLSVSSVGITRTKELFQRWLELSVFTTIIRLHTTNEADENHQYNTDEETLEHFADMSHLYASLAPYRAELMAEAEATGMPLIRHLMLHYPDDPQVYDLNQQFLLGPDLLVAPVVHEGESEVTLYLPEGDWVRLGSGAAVSSSGEWITVAAPIGDPAAFYRSGSGLEAQLQP